jgi:hypothetical protein
VSGAAYEATSPVEMPHHILLRKVYAILAFALLGFLLDRSEVPRVRGVAAAALVIGLYSYGIELGQIVIDHSSETFGEHGFDIVSGLAGGALGAWIAGFSGGAASRTRRIELAAVAAIFAVTAWIYTLTYGPLDR